MGEFTRDKKTENESWAAYFGRLVDSYDTHMDELGLGLSVSLIRY